MINIFKMTVLNLQLRIFFRIYTFNSLNATLNSLIFMHSILKISFMGIFSKFKGTFSELKGIFSAFTGT